MNTPETFKYANIGPWKSKSYLYHILPPLSVIVVVSSIVKILVFLLQVDAALAAFLPDVAVCAAHVTEAKDGESDRN